MASVDVFTYLNICVCFSEAKIFRANTYIKKNKYINTLCFLRIGFFYKYHTELTMLDNSGFQTTYVQ